MKKWIPIFLGLFLLFPGLSNVHAASIADQIIATGTAYMGTPYQYGAPAGQTKTFDCSSFTQFIFGKNGISLPRTTKDQYNRGSWVTRANLQKGDLVFFNTGGKGTVSHVGVYAGNGEMIHVSSSKGVMKTKFAGNTYWEPRYMGAKRVIQSQVARAAGTNTTTHTVKSGESLWILANRYGTSVAAIKNLNGLRSDMIYPGQVLKVASRHTVSYGESLWIIAKKYGTTVTALKKLNGLSSDKIYAGQVLRIA